jgi:two-component system KDP operon response regulator KdpE
MYIPDMVPTSGESSHTPAPRSSSAPDASILVIDDEPKVRDAVRAALADEVVRVLEAADGTSGLATAVAQRPDLVVLDLGLPDMEGVEVARALRRWSSAPIIVLTARHADDEKVRLLDIGADDYVTKPFSSSELRARVHAQLRRARMAPIPGGDAPVVTGDLSVDFARRIVTRAGATVHLTRTEWGLLEALLKHADRPVTHRQLFHAVWGNASGDAQHYLRVYIAHLRRKLEADPYSPRLILTEPGVGYRFVLSEVPTAG